MASWAVVLAGGTGTRFWPLSTAAVPKQFLPLAGAHPLLVETVARLDGLVAPERTLVVTAASLAARTRALLAPLPPENILAEPRAASTAPALVWATHVAQRQDPDAVVLSLHADGYVDDGERFRQTAAQALDVAARYDVLVTVGVVPTRPETGYGYIEPGEPLAGDARRVARFVEKPDAARARALIARGALWNSGLFAWTGGRFFAETASVAPEIARHLPLLAAGETASFFAAVTPVAVDVSHFERSRRVAVVTARFGWDDVGTWVALARVRGADAAGNVAVGEAALRDAADCIVWAADRPIVVDGVQGLVIVSAHGVTLVTTRERAADLKSLLEALPPALRDRAP